MKRANHLWPLFISFPNLYAAYANARLGKQSRDSVAAFSLDLEANLFDLQNSLETGNYQPGAYRQFIIRERKARLISAAPFRDRVIHHAIMNVLEPVFEKQFYYHSYACRKGKGTHQAVDQYQQCAKRYAYVLKVDIARYFPSIRHDCLKAQLQRLLKDKKILQVLATVIDSSPVEQPGVGLPIGNLTSQYFANLYLNDIDHWITRQPQCKAYLRYVDDLIIFGNNKTELWLLRDKLKVQFKAIGLQMHAKKQQIYPTRERVDVLGYIISRERRWLRNDNGYRFQRKLKKQQRQVVQGIVPEERARASVMSWIGHALHGETGALRACLYLSEPDVF